ncbi:MAG: hypothetical protein ACRBBR_03520 [Cellvibrionaceae bacterium]
MNFPTSLLYSLGLYFVLSSSALANWDTVKNRCIKPNNDEKIVTQRDFGWGLSHIDNLTKESEIYNSGKRLFQRSYYDEVSNSFILPHSVIGETSNVKLTKQFIASVRNHIENGLRKKYSEAIVFSDMGHSHLYFPKGHWEKNYLHLIREKKLALLYERMLADPELRVLYHTAEQITLKVDGAVLPDPKSQFRYLNRNILGYNNNKELKVLFANKNKRYNTVVEIDGLHRWSAGFNISASKDGCFPYQTNGETRYFDISLTSLPYRDKRIQSRFGYTPPPLTRISSN